MTAVGQGPIFAGLIVGVLLVPIAARAVNLNKGIEELAVRLGESVPEARVLRVAVTDFPDLEGVTSNLGRHIGESLTTRLSNQTQKFRVIERRRLGLVLRELKFSMSDLVDPNKAKQLGRMLGVEGLVAGSISDLGNSVEVNARIIEIETNNILPGVSVTLTKDQRVEKMLSEGRMAERPQPPIGEPRTSGGIGDVLRGNLPVKSGSYVVGRSFSTGWQTVDLLSIEIAEGRFLNFNFMFNSRGNWGHAAAEVHLDNPRDTAFLVDQLGRQHPLLQAVGLSSEQVVTVPDNSSRRFTLTFPFTAGVQSFTYQAIVVVRWNKAGGSGEDRIRIQADRAVKVSDFR